MRCSAIVCCLKRGVTNFTFEPNPRSMKPAVAMHGALTLVVSSILLLVTALPAQAQTEGVLYNFAGAPGRRSESLGHAAHLTQGEIFKRQPT